jgi:hypothetical protein
MPKTYEPIATQTLTADAGQVVFSSIPQTYTDLVLAINSGTVSLASYDLLLRFNNDSGSNYSQTILLGNGTSASSTRLSNRTAVYIDYSGGTAMGINKVHLVHIMNYANTTTYKTFINRAGIADGATELNVALWRSTAAVSSIQIPTNGYGIMAGSVFTLYGIKAA